MEEEDHLHQAWEGVGVVHYPAVEVEEADLHLGGEVVVVHRLGEEGVVVHRLGEEEVEEYHLEVVVEEVCHLEGVVEEAHHLVVVEEGVVLQLEEQSLGQVHQAEVQ